MLVLILQRVTQKRAVLPLSPPWMRQGMRLHGLQQQNRPEKRLRQQNRSAVPMLQIKQQKRPVRLLNRPVSRGPDRLRQTNFFLRISSQ